MTRVGLIGGKDIRSSIDCAVKAFPWLLMVFTRALTEAVRSVLLRCFLDWYWLSVGLPSMKLMVGQDSRACSISAIVLSVVRAAVAPWVGSLTYRLRWPA